MLPFSDKFRGIEVCMDLEMNELLESALDDFDKAKPSQALPPVTIAPYASDSQKRSPADTAKDALFASKEFFQKLFDPELACLATAEFEKAMKELTEEEPHLVELSEEVGRVGSDTTSQQEFASCLKDTLSGLAKSATDLHNSGKAMEGLGIKKEEGEGNILPIMHIKSQIYPTWWQNYHEALPPEQSEKYQEQHNVMGKIYEQFEKETAADSEATQKASFEMVLDLMQQLQNLGHTPKELAGKMLPGFNFDLGTLNLLGLSSSSGEQCLIM
uniref:Peroxisomal biogenesis factor 19 n=1 Tax=Vombatus ursinus TaxID=29139 RepID=A0A4X2MA51_VOMUR